MNSKIDPKQFIYLIELMQKYLFQLAAPSMEEAIAVYRQNDDASIQAVLKEIDVLLSGKFSKADLTEFVEVHSDYMVGDSGMETLKLIRKVLAEKN